MQKSTERFVLYFDDWFNEFQIRSESALGPERHLAAGSLGACVAAKRLFESEPKTTPEGP